jgi:hypothetical protein
VLLACAALAAGCGSSTAQDTPAAPYAVVDSTGAVLGPLLGTSVTWSLQTTQANVGGTMAVTSVQLVPTGQYNSFLDPGKRLWSVNGSGSFAQLEPAIAYLTADCSGAAYLRWGNPSLVMYYGGGFKTVTGPPTSVVPPRLVPPRSPPGACLPYAGTPLLLWPETAVTAVSPPAVVPPVTIR